MMLSDQLWVWISFNTLLVILLFLDLVVLGRARTVSMREAVLGTIFWTAIAFAVNGAIFFFGSKAEGTDFLTAYIVERALSIDNLFVFLVIFTYFGVPKQFQMRALLWGIIGALVARAVFITAGVAVINAFEPVVYVLGAFLIYTAYKLATSGDSEVDPERNIALRLARKYFTVSDDYDGQKMFTRIGGSARAITPMLLVVIVLATTDVVFAVDSIPSVLAITTDGFIVWSSNAMAVLGMRPLFFVLAGAVAHFRYLQYGLAAVLGFVGFKMISEEFIHIETILSLAVILAALGVSMLASWVLPDREPEEADGPGESTEVEG
ncbi:MAG: TerC/Alx family metal homeostasis membrane protein [Dehalococcoidia bacterium]|nr:TerC/Alx family metal homeostasis membrane protein [Dehalococcoidia bacterium]